MTRKDFGDLLSKRAVEAGLAIDRALIEKLEAYYRALARWNTRLNLTGLPLNPPTNKAIDRLLVEPLLTAHAFQGGADIWFDLGSGGGSPAVPFQLFKPAKRLVMVESKERKAAFLRELIRELPLPGAEVEVSRIESVARVHRWTGLADLVTLRAVRLSQPILGGIRDLLRIGGQGILFGMQIEGISLPEELEILPLELNWTSSTVLRRTQR
jgi:16S rRNA (guanine(527)-N(7))-methyltransferase RsmG